MEIPPDGERAPDKVPLGRRLYRAVEEKLGSAAPALPIGLFVAAWGYLNWFLSSRYPEEGSGLSFLVPSVEGTGALLLLCALSFVTKKPPKVLFLLLTLLLVPLRLLRVADALTRAAFDRPFHLALDLGQLWELLILLDDTIDRVTLIGYLALSAVLLGFLFFLVKQALHYAGNFFVEKKHRIGFAVVGGLLLLGELATGGVFADSLSARAVEEIDIAMSADALRTTREAQLVAAKEAMAHGPSDLAVLREADLHLLVVPRYAQLLRDDPRFSPELRQRWARFQEALVGDGYGVRSTLFQAGERAGLVSYEVATLQTGVPVRDEIDFELLLEHEVETLGHHYRDAGYRSVRAMPGETRERPERELGGFDLTHHSWELGYLGPAYGRSPMPDQYVLSLIRDREFWEAEQPLFVMYELSSSVPPFSPLPPYVEDWSQVRTGEIYRDSPPGEARHSYFELADAGEDYVAAISYVLDVLEGYLTEAVDMPAPEGRGRDSRRARRRRPDPLYVVVGDHPPPKSLAGEDAPRGVIAHAISREARHLVPFEERGWTEGVVPTVEAAEEAHDALTALLVQGLSEAPAGDEE